jgi:hypothetical protein
MAAEDEKKEKLKGMRERFWVIVNSVSSRVL